MKQIWYAFKTCAISSVSLRFALCLIIGNQLGNLYFNGSFSLTEFIYCIIGILSGILIGSILLPKYLFFKEKNRIKKYINKYPHDFEFEKKLLKIEFSQRILFPKDLQKLNDLIESYNEKSISPST